MDERNRLAQVTTSCLEVVQGLLRQRACGPIDERARGRDVIADLRESRPKPALDGPVDELDCLLLETAEEVGLRRRHQLLPVKSGSSSRRMTRGPSSTRARKPLPRFAANSLRSKMVQLTARPALSPAS